MKTSLLVILNTICLTVFGQFSFPTSVQECLTKNFPEIESFDYITNPNSNDQIKFYYGKKTVEISFNEVDGLVKLEQEIDQEDIPLLVTNRLDKNYNNYKIIEATKIETAKVVSYLIIIETETDVYKKIYSKEGEEIKGGLI